MTTPAPAAPAATPAPVVPAAPPVAPPTPPAPTAAAPSTPAAPTATTPLSPTSPTATPTAPVPGDWGDGWRLKMASGNAELAKQLERFQSPVAVFESLVETKKKLSSTRPTALPANATPEQVAQFRKDNGVPEKPEDYKLEPGEGRVIGEFDKPIVDKIVKSFHGRNATPAEVNNAVKLYFDLQDEQIGQMEARDVADRKTVDDALHAELGGEYRANINAVEGLLATFPDGIGESIKDARLPDGSALFNSAPFLRTMIKIANELNPAATIVPGSTGAASSAVSDQISKYRGMMADGTWDTHPEREKFKKHYQELISAQEKLQARAA